MSLLRLTLAKKMISVCLLLTFMSSVALAVCVETDGGVDETGMPFTKNGVANEGGIGGTGMLAKGGIGGTGIVGTITGFASVCINGLEVDYENATQVSSNGEAASIHQLAIGQVIAIDAADGTNRLQAHRIDILNAVEGPVTTIRTEARLIEVMGQKIRLNDATQLEGANTNQKITVGMKLKVSGYRNSSNEIVASRIEAAPDMKSSSIIGVVERGSDGQYRIAGIPVKTDGSSLVTGSELLAKGAWDGLTFHVASARYDPSLPFAGHASRVVVEGLVIDRIGEHQIKISGFDIDYSNLTSLSGGGVEQLIQGRLVRVVGYLQSGHRLRADHVEIMRRPDTAPIQMKNGAMLRQDGLHRPMPATRPNSPMPMMRR